MTPQTLFQFLFGDANAIERVLIHAHALPIAALFVLSAALARSYDTRSILHRPRHFFAPFYVSCGLCALLYLAARLELAMTRDGTPLVWLWSARSLLAAYWMTAPLAWLYGMPFERLLSPERAVVARLATLAIVATWRVLLMGRILTILFDHRASAGYALAFGFGATMVVFASIKRLASAGSKSTPVLIADMASIPAKNRSARQAADRVLTIATPIAALVAPLCAVVLLGSATTAWSWAMIASQVGPESAWSLYTFAAGSVAFWMLAASARQPAHFCAARADQFLAAGRLHEGFAYLSRFSRRELPPTWEPLPGSFFREPPTILEAYRTVLESRPAEWIARHCEMRFRDYLSDAIWYYHYGDEFLAAIDLIERSPDRLALARIASAAIAEHERELTAYTASLRELVVPEFQDRAPVPFVLPLPRHEEHRRRLIARLRAIAAE